jgi:hypothetical protein
VPTRPLFDERTALVLEQPLPGPLADPPIDAVLALEAFITSCVRLRQRASVPLLERARGGALYAGRPVRDLASLRPLVVMRR